MSRDSVIIRHAVDQTADLRDHYDDGLGGDFDIRCDGVPYSMNKKRRWAIPGLIKEKFNKANHEKDGFRIHFVERHKIRKSADCVSLTTTCCSDVVNGELRETKPHGYFQKSSVTNQASRQTTQGATRRGDGLYVAAENNHENSRYNTDNWMNVGPTSKRRHDVALTSGQREANTNGYMGNQPTKVVYDVYHAAKPTCSLRRDPKSIKFISNSFYKQKLFATRRRQTTRRNTSRQWMRVSQELVDEALDTLDETAEGSKEDIICDWSDEHGSIGRPPNTNLASFLENAASLDKVGKTHRKAKRKKRDSSRIRVCPMDTKRNVIYMNCVNPEVSEAAIEERSQIVSESVNIKHGDVLEPVEVTFPLNAISPCVLRHKLGHSYFESKCIPRRFVIDISNKISSLDTRRRHKENAIMVSAYLVIQVENDDTRSTHTNSVGCKIRLNTMFNDRLKHVSVETMSNNIFTSVDEFINRLVVIIDSLPTDYIIPSNAVVSYRNDRVNWSNLEELAPCSTSSRIVDEEFLLQNFTSCVRHDIEHDVTHCTGSDIEHGAARCRPGGTGRDIEHGVTDYRSEDTGAVEESDIRETPCGICYDICSGTSLTSCGHWFCDRCWSHYLNIKIHSRSASLLCPGHDCDVGVDPGTVMSLISLSAIVQHALCRHDNEVSRRADTGWCPNQMCGRVLRVSSQDTCINIATCVCGERICIGCRLKPHWPASCYLAKRYHKMLFSKSDVGILPPELTLGMKVNGKHCPNCRRFVEKRSGCKFMRCVCGDNFCWACGKPWNGYKHYKCIDVGYNNNHCTTTKIVDSGDALSKLNRRKWYKIALTHRVAQHPVKFKKMTEVTVTLSRQIKEAMSRSGRNGHVVNVEFKNEGKRYLSECDKVPDFLKCMIELYGEVSRIVEYIAVILDSQCESRQAVDTTLASFIDRLGPGVSTTYNLFMGASERHAIDTLTQMQKVRKLSRSAIRELVNYFKLRRPESPESPQ